MRIRRAISGHLAITAVILTIGAIVAVEHTGSIDAMHMHDAMIVCLAILPLAALATATAVLIVRGGRDILAPIHLRARGPAVTPTAPAPRSRAGPLTVRSVVLRL